MSTSESTCWTVIRAGAAGSARDREELARRYLGVVRAYRRQRQQAEQSGPDAVQRVELLRLRFEEGLPIRTIAERWGVPAATLHHAYARAR
jgi:hypothetical protein